MPVAPTGHRIGTMTMPSCWAHLASARIGRLKFHTGRGPRAVAVTYALFSDGLSSGVLLLLPAYNDAAGYAAGSEVTFEVEGADPGSDHWVVQLTGVARRLTEAQARAGQLGKSGEYGLEQWPADVPCRYVYIPAEMIAGSRGTAM